MPVIRQQAADDEDLQYVPPPGPVQRERKSEQAQDAALLQELLEKDKSPTPARSARAVAAPRVAPVPPRRAPARPAPPPTDEEEEWEPPAIPRPVTGAGGLTPGQQVFVELCAFLVFGATVYAMDMAFTLLGLTRALLPATVAGLSLGAIFHIFMSLGQRYFVFQRGPIRMLGATLLGVNTVTNLYGIIPAIDATLGADLLGSLPRDPAFWSRTIYGNIWSAILAAVGRGPQMAAILPPWWPAMLALIVFCACVAWWAEILLSQFYLRLRYVVVRHMS